MSPKPKDKAFRVGVVAALAMLALAVFIVGISSRRGWFHKRVTLYSRFSDAQGLKKGDSVWFQGVEVGYIAELNFVDDPETGKTLVEVEMKVDGNLLPMLHKSTRARISNVGLLGDKYVALVPSPMPPRDDPNILPGATVPAERGASLAELGKGAEDLLASITEIADNLRSLTDSIQHGGGVISRLLLDPKLGKETMDRLNHIAAQLDGVVSGLNRGEGAAGALLRDPAGRKAVHDLARTASTLAELMDGVGEGKGTLGRLLAPGSEGEAMVGHLAKAAANLETLTSGMADPDSLTYALAADPETGRATAEHIRSAAAHLDSILAKIDRGEGPVGALVNDRAVYDTLAAVVEGIQQSALVRWYLKHRAKKAARKAAREAAREEKRRNRAGETAGDR